MVCVARSFQLLANKPQRQAKLGVTSLLALACSVAGELLAGKGAHCCRWLCRLQGQVKLFVSLTPASLSLLLLLLSLLSSLVDTSIREQVRRSFFPSRVSVVCVCVCDLATKERKTKTTKTSERYKRTSSRLLLVFSLSTLDPLVGLSSPPVCTGLQPRRARSESMDQSESY